MKKQIWMVFFILGITAMLLAAGCGRRSETALENELAYRQLGINKMNEGDYEEAVKMFQRALDQSMAVIDDLELDISYYKALAQYRSGDTEGALATYTALIEYDEKNADALYLRGTLYLQEGDAKNAWKDYESALKEAPKDIALSNKIAVNLSGVGETGKAGEILNRALEVKEKDAADYREKGWTYYLLGQYDSARTCLNKARDEGDTEAVYCLAKVCEAQGDTEEANELYELYVESHSDDTETLNALGLARLSEGSYDQALTFFQKALEQEHPANEQELRRNEIIALEYLQDFAQAREKMTSYLADYPDDEAAAREYEFLQSR